MIEQKNISQKWIDQGHKAIRIMSIQPSKPDRTSKIYPYITIRSNQYQTNKTLKTIPRNRLGLIRTDQKINPKYKNDLETN